MFANKFMYGDIMKMCTFPTEEKNSSRSLALILWDNCIQNTVRASRSSGESSSTGLLKKKKKKSEYSHVKKFNT
jgi:hypothetical protein